MGWASSRQKVRPSQAAKTVENTTSKNDLEHSSIDQIGTWDRPLHSVENSIFLCPIHDEETNDGKDANNGLEGDKEASKQEEIDNIDIFETWLKDDILVNIVELGLVQSQSRV